MFKCPLNCFISYYIVYPETRYKFLFFLCLNSHTIELTSNCHPALKELGQFKFFQLFDILEFYLSKVQILPYLLYQNRITHATDILLSYQTLVFPYRCSQQLTFCQLSSLTQ